MVMIITMKNSSQMASIKYNHNHKWESWSWSWSWCCWWWWWFVIKIIIIINDYDNIPPDHVIWLKVPPSIQGQTLNVKINLNSFAIPKTQRVIPWGLLTTGYPSLSNSSLNLVYNCVMEWWTLELKHTGGVDKTSKYGRTLHGYGSGISWHFKIFLVRSIKSSKLANSGKINSVQHQKKNSFVNVLHNRIDTNHNKRTEHRRWVFLFLQKA